MSQTRYLKSMITPTLVEPTENHEAGVASGVWSTQDQLEARRGGVWPEAGIANPDTIIEGNFSIDLFTGTGSTQDITNGIDLLNKGGLVWGKTRNRSSGDFYSRHFLYDTERGTGTSAYLHSDQAEAQGATGAVSPGIVFNANGFTTPGPLNNNNEAAVAWTFKKAPKFFDIVKFEGTGSARTVAHNLGSVPGMVIVKRTDGNGQWFTYHRGVDGSSPEDYWLKLNGTDARDTGDYFNDTAPTDSVFSVSSSTNNSGENYVAYLFAHETGDDSMIQCGNYTGAESSTSPVIDLGWEPQWLLIKNAAYSNDAVPWLILDTMRGLTVGGNDAKLSANTAGAEESSAVVNLNGSGFQIAAASTVVNRNNDNYIYVAIRRPNMATITDATKVFATDTRTNSEGEGKYDSGFPVDFSIARTFDATSNSFAFTRLTNSTLKTNSNADEGTSDGDVAWDVMDGFTIGGSGLNAFFGGSTDNINWMWKRAKGYFDIVAYEGTGSNRTVTHGLGAIPEMMWVKSRDDNEDWSVYHANMSGTPQNTYQYLNLNSAAGTSNTIKYWNHTAPTSSVFTVGIEDRVNTSGDSYIAYLFATLAGVSKCFGVTHSGSSTDVDCGFAAGARFVMLKRTDATDPWYVWDSVRGIIAGNDPYLIFNTNAAQETSTDFIDPLASGFQISGSFQDGDYIGWAIA